MSEIIYFNGKKHNSIAEMSPAERRLYDKLNRFMADHNRDDIPDIIQSGGLTAIKEIVNLIFAFRQMIKA